MQLFLKMRSGKANNVDPDQTGPSGAVWSWSALFAYSILLVASEFFDIYLCQRYRIKVGDEQVFSVMDEKRFGQAIILPFGLPSAPTFSIGHEFVANSGYGLFSFVHVMNWCQVYFYSFCCMLCVIVVLVLEQMRMNCNVLSY